MVKNFELLKFELPIEMRGVHLNSVSEYSKDLRFRKKNIQHRVHLVKSLVEEP